jgi:hypothetical protein
MMTGKRFIHVVIVVFTVLALVSLYSCSSGGGGGGTAPAAGSTALVARGVMTKGSVVLNSVHYTAAAGAAIRIDDNPGRPETELRDGMEVKVKGTINDDRITGQFEKVESEPEVRGQISSSGANSMVINGQTVFTDDLTVFEDRVAGVFSTITFAALTAGVDKVEVHGGRDDLGRVRASRVERRDDNPEAEVKGTVSTVPTGTVFTLTNGTTSILVSYAGATILPAGSTLALSNFVEVHGIFSAGTLTATRVDREDLEDAEFEPAEGQEFRAEGYITGFTAHPGEFQVSDRTVRTTSATAFVGGAPVDLDNNVKVEAAGHLTLGVLVAEKIEFKRSVVRIQATATGHTAGSVTVMDKVMTIDPAIVTGNLALGAIVDNTTRVQVRGYIDKTGTIVGVRLDSVGGGGDFLQAPVTAKNATAKTLVLMSGGIAVTADLSGVSDSNFLNVNHAPIGSAAFFAAVTPASGSAAGTLVKVKGTYSAGTITGTEAEIEN